MEGVAEDGGVGVSNDDGGTKMGVEATAVVEDCADRGNVGGIHQQSIMLGPTQPGAASQPQAGDHGYLGVTKYLVHRELNCSLRIGRSDGAPKRDAQTTSIKTPPSGGAHAKGKEDLSPTWAGRAP